ncbi:NADPH--cytochrome P450 reductase like protein [Argiope bruennichi]|uniref:NADPH--hemoprotein reductase n=1 Tax=Argiope bruennichi TaxID=94029 RepID=A0A8T0E9F2_ARGBR|nr:NADPH--cytochrome P450 reductase like protein [Argiope bruennichi]
MAEKLEMHEIPKSATEESLIAQQHFGPIDICVIIAVISAVVYYMFFRKKKEINTFQITPNHVTTSDSSFINKMKSTGRNVIVFYGSQTGTAEEFATRLAKEANRYGMKAMVADPEDYDMEDLCKVPEIENSLVIFCMATYGEGDPTDNAQEFYQWLQTGDGDLSGLNYAVFGLGNKTYEHYNSMGIYVDKRVEELGGTRVFELGLGDDDANIEEDFITWKERFWSAVCEHFHIETLGEDINLRQYELVVHEDLPPEKIFTGEISRLNSYKNQRPPYDMKNPFLSTVTVNRELYRGERSCMHIELDITDSRIRYDTGDHVAIYPTNDIALVEKLGKLLNADLDTVFSLNNLDEDSTKKHPFPCPTTYRTALLHYVDITSIPRTHVLKEISEYATDEEEKKMLKLMATSSEEGKKLYLSWVLHASSIHITAVLVEYETPTKRITRGVATGWLKTLKPGDRVPIFVRRSQFRLPSKPHIPIIMIGPGTGLAPFRGFLQERSFQRKEGKEVGDSILYFGCRKSKEDFLYEDELKTFEEEGTLTKLHAAFSRDQPEKLYVTHLLNANKDELWRVFGESSGHIYVCGDARNMAKDVHNIILEIVQEYGKKTKDEAEAYIKKMESQRRYSADVWS